MSTSDSQQTHRKPTPFTGGSFTSKLLLLPILLLSLVLPLSHATSVWDGRTLCSNNWAGGTACWGNIEYTTSSSLSGDLNISGNILIDSGVTLDTNGYSIMEGGVFNNLGTIVGGASNDGAAGCNNGDGCNRGQNSAGGAGSYGVYIQACGFSNVGMINLDGYTPNTNAGWSGASASGGVGGYTLASGGNAGNPYPTSGSAYTGAITLTNPAILNMYLSNFVNYLTGGGGGGGGTQFSNGNNGGSYYGSWGGSGGGGVGVYAHTGYDVAGGWGGGGGAGIGILAYGSSCGTITAPGGTYSVNGGGSSGNPSSGAGGGGRIVTYGYGIVQPLITPYIPPQVSNVLPNTGVLQLSSTAFTVNITQTTYALKNYTIFWGDGTNTPITTSSTSNIVMHTYPYVAHTTTFIVSVYSCDVMGNCNDSFTQAISAYYNPPTVTSISPTSVLEAQSNIFTINSVTMSYALKNTTVNWGDGSSNIITSSSNSITTSHTYSYVADAKPDSFNANVVVCDTNKVCITAPFTILGTYTIPILNMITPSAQAYSTLADSFTFNIIQGSYPLSSLQVMWGDGNSISNAISSLTPSLSYTYQTPGNYVIQGIAIDNNLAQSIPFSYNVVVLPYIIPSISALAPTSVYSANLISYKFTVTQGTFSLPTNSLIINWGNGESNTINAIVGLNAFSFTYPNNGNYSIFETINDINNYKGYNTTLINVGPYPWNFTTPYPIIYYNVTNKTTQMLVQTRENDNLPVSYSVQKQNIANDYLCSTSISNAGLFSISCVTNPNIFSYSNQTLSVAITATDTHGSTKLLVETIKLTPKSPPPVPPVTPFNTNTVAQPLTTPPFIPLNAIIITAILSAGSILAVVAAYISRGKKRR